MSKDLTGRQKNLLEYGGAFGALLSLTCLIQHLVVAIPNQITNPMIPVYIFAMVVFILLALQKIVAFYLLIFSSILSLIVEYLWMKNASFSAVVLSLFIYHVIMIVAIYAEQVPQSLKEKIRAKKEEEDYWNKKLQ